MAKKFLPEFRWMGRNMIAFNVVLISCCCYGFCCCIWLNFHSKEKSLEISKAYQFLSILRYPGISECFNLFLWGIFLTLVQG